ncbi:SulP family inorganic anion transporter [Novosphingobium resinovorum]|uniref:SulP family inorganic anion transporter n=2 Tax=Novosphingobium TaxID=165696 RepID=UPI001B3C976F|nr:SulP family inorganic anion transporter [Novosphingobium resinovorum]MBF7013732.1 SulP family inorganic anion transporter [Novosphingobium sp. HR1a]WJM25875.1 SulP family inorganic anion transporter [Novosphingobium resinovorum]
MRGRDVIAGLSIAGLMLPEAIAYAGIAGLPPQRAILAAIVGACAYLTVGRSRFAIISPTSSSAAILAAALASLPPEGISAGMLATLIVGMVGVLFCVISAARLGGLASFISRPVLRGFAFGLAITIIVKQLPVALGVSLHSSSIGALLIALLRGFAQWHLASLATAAFALATLLLLRKVPAVPGAFVVLVGGVGSSMLLDLPAHGVASVGTITLVPRWDGLGLPNWKELSRILQLAVPIVLILLAESWGTMRTLALRHGDRVDANREMAALGIANIAACAVQGMPVGTGFSAGSAAEAAGSTTRWTGLVAAGALAALVVLAMPLVARLPEPVLAAVVVAALAHALDPGPLIRLWRIRRDAAAALGAAGGVLALGVLDGMLFAIGLSLALLIRRLATPQLSMLGQLGTGHDYVDIARHPEVSVPAGMTIVRPAEPLFFANAERVLGRIADLPSLRSDGAKLIISLEESFDIDSTALDALLEFAGQMQTRGVSLRLARVRDHVRDLMAAADAADLIARSSYSVDDAVQMLEEETSRCRT